MQRSGNVLRAQSGNYCKHLHSCGEGHNALRAEESLDVLSSVQML
jgi:hypothetical protein